MTTSTQDQSMTQESTQVLHAYVRVVEGHNTTYETHTCTGVREERPNSTKLVLECVLQPYEGDTRVVGRGNPYEYKLSSHGRRLSVVIDRERLLSIEPDRVEVLMTTEHAQRYAEEK